MSNSQTLLVMLSMYKDIDAFHRKFNLPQFDGVGNLPDDLLGFRARFLQEEAKEIRDATVKKSKVDALDGFVDLAYVALGTAWLAGADQLSIPFEDQPFGFFDTFKLADGIAPEAVSVPLCFRIARGCRDMALESGFNFDAAWSRVHYANMKKVRATDSSGKRRSQWDVVKPEGWTAPDLGDLV